MLLGFALIACTSVSDTDLNESCSDTPPIEGEIRAKKIVCEEELPEGSEAEVGDWLLENHWIKLTIRGATHRLTQLEGTGGTILDAAVQGGSDAVTEIFPIFNQWPESADISAVENGIQVVPRDGNGETWTYHLSSDKGLIRVDGAAGFTLVPAHGAYRTGDVIQSTHDQPLTVAATGGIIDDGGWVHWSDTQELALGSIDDIAATLHGEVVTAIGETDGSALQVRNDSFGYAFWIENGEFEIEVPIGSEIRALRAGFKPSSWSDPSVDMNLPLGEEGFISTSITDTSGTPIPAVLNWNGRQYNLKPETVTVPVGPGEGMGWIDAGPKYHPFAIESQTISGTVSLDALMEKVVLESALVAVDVPAFPDQTERRFTDDLLIELAANSVDYAILSAGDEVAQASASENLSVGISFHAGSRSESDMGSPIAFPWSNNRRAPAHGAAPWQDLSPLDLLAYMSKAGRRTTIVDRRWVESAGSPVDWDPIPDWFIVREFQDLQTYTNILDHWIPATLLGETTWVTTPENNRTAILRGMAEGKTTATTGPQVLFSIDEHSQGANLHNEFGDLEFNPVVDITVERPGDIERLALIGSGGEELVSWKLGSPPSHFPLNNSDWVLVTARGEADWAITNPIWLNRP